MKEFRKIFVSHHHNDAAALSQVKNFLAVWGFKCFIAHEDIAPREHDLERIEKEIRDCDAFLYIGGEDANASTFCQQEIGMARALDKEIITTMTKGNPPEGFIKPIQAISYTEIGTDFRNAVYSELCKIFPPPERIKKRLKNLGRECFSQTQRNGTIRLLKNNWDDYGFQTEFHINIDSKNIGEVKIGFLGQTESQPTHKYLPDNFFYLESSFFSRVFIDTGQQNPLTRQQVNSLKYLLNDIELISEKKRAIVSKERVYNVSLFRNY